MDKIPYEKIWKEMMLEVFENDEKTNNRIKWESVEHAREYWERTKRDKKRPLNQLELINPKKDDRILDIGSGPGTIAIPAAKISKEVLAVEPSIGMCTVLLERAKEENLSNISVIQKKWEDVSEEELGENKFDIVVASFSISIPDIAEEIKKMNSVCKGRVFIFWFAGSFSWDDLEFEEFWKGIKSKDFYPGPKADLLYAILSDLKIYPDVSTYSLKVSDTFDSVEEACKKICQRHSVTDELDKKQVLEFLKSKYKDNSEKIKITGSSNRVCMWWNVKTKTGQN